MVVGIATHTAPYAPIAHEVELASTNTRRLPNTGESSVSTAIGELLDAHVITSGAAPGAAAGVARRVGSSWRWSIGSAGRTDPFNGDVVTVDTWFDLASLTKSMTALGVARAVERDLMRWDAPLVEYLPELNGTFGASASLLSLLSHRAGFVPHVSLADASVATLRALADARRSDLTSRPHPNRSASDLEPHAPVYSDVGYILAGLALQSCVQMPLDDYLASELAAMATSTSDALEWPEALGSSRHLLQRGLDVSRVAATEVVPTRGGLVRGQVHDDNAWLLSETNTSGHAGMFGTARGVLGMATLLLDLVAGHSTALGPTSLTALLSPRPDGALRAGFDAKAQSGPSMVGSVLGPRTFGHLGFTGTSYWCDPDCQSIVVLLTNRVCPAKTNTRLRTVRPVVHDALARLALGLGG